MNGGTTKHNLTLRGRTKLEITSVSDIGSFDDTSVVLFTSEGELTIEGGNLHIEHFDSTTGEIMLTGNIDGLYYSNSFGETAIKNNKKNAFSKLLR